MNFRRLVVMGFFLFIASTQAAEKENQPAAELPIELFAAHAQYRDMVVSPDGKHIAFTFEEDDNEVKLAIVTSDIKKITAVFGFGKDHHVGGHYWVNNDRLVMSVWKNTGFLDGRRQMAKAFGANLDGTNRRQLFVAGPAGFRFISRLRNDPKNILVGKYDVRDKGQIKLHRLNVNNGKMDYIAGIPGATPGAEMVNVAVDTDDQIRVAIEVDRGKEDYDDDDDLTTIHYRTVGGEWRQLSMNQVRKAARFFVVGFSRDNSRFYFLSNHDMVENDTLGLFEFDFGSTKISLLFRHPDVDIQGGIYGSEGEVLGVRYAPGYPEKFYFDESNSQVQTLKSLSAAFPAQNVSIRSYTEDGKAAIVSVSSERNPGDYYMFKDGKLKHLASIYPDIKPELLGRTEAFTLKARDGVKLYGFITLPLGREAKNLPMVVYPHGGPHGPYDQWRYDPLIQILVNRGYAVLQVNFRGSGGYGSDFMESGYRKWGREMQDDVTDATLWAVQQGIADNGRICILGGSYGGYATLQGVVREPDLYQCAIGIAGVYSLPMFRKKGGYRRNRAASKVFLDKIVGEDQAELKAYSPAYNVDRIKAALFIIHGSKDARVPVEQAEFLRDQLDAIGKPYKWLVKPEGHGFTQVDNRIDQYDQMLKFLDRHIGAKSQAVH